MKRYIVLALLVFSGMQLSAQTKSVIDQFFQKYEGDESSTVVNIPPKTFSIFSKLDINTKEGEQFNQLLKQISGFRLIAKENTDRGKQMFKEAYSFLTKDFEDLLTVRDGKDDVRFMVKENGRGNISELVMLVGGEKEFVAMSLTGDINLSEIGKLANGVNIEGMKHLKKIKDSK